MPIIEDQELAPIISSLYDCFVKQMDKRGLTDRCTIAILHGVGDIPAVPNVGEAYGWVGLQNAFPYSTFPNPDTSLSNCARPIAGLLSIGVLRCYSPTAEMERPETMAELLALQLADMAAIKAAVMCCKAGNPDGNFQLGTYTPLGPDGGTYGGRFDLYVG